jgi:hypothetical protein
MRKQVYDVIKVAAIKKSTFRMGVFRQQDFFFAPLKPAYLNKLISEPAGGLQQTLIIPINTKRRRNKNER